MESEQGNENKITLPFYKWASGIGPAGWFASIFLEGQMNNSSWFSEAISMLCLLILAYGCLGWTFSFAKIEREHANKFYFVFFGSIALCSFLLFFQFGTLKKSLFQRETVHIGEHYRNEEIPLDYNVYRQCTFENVTLLFNGGPGTIDTCTFLGAPVIFTTSPEVTNTMLIEKSMLEMTDSLKKPMPFEFRKQ